MSSIRSEVIDLDLIEPNPWNPNRMDGAMYHKELASLRKFGYVNPIIVRQLAADHYQVIDGEHRLKGLHELGHRRERMTIVDGLSDEDAKQLTVVLNETKGKPDQKKLGELLNDLLVTVPKTDLLDLLPISPVVFDKLVGLDDFDWSSLDAPQPAETRGWVERTYRLPRDAAAVLDDAIKAARDGSEDDDWQGLERIAAEFLATYGSPPVAANTSATPRPKPMGRA